MRARKWSWLALILSLGGGRKDLCPDEMKVRDDGQAWRRRRRRRRRRRKRRIDQKISSVSFPCIM